MTRLYLFCAILFPAFARADAPAEAVDGAATSSVSRPSRVWVADGQLRVSLSSRFESNVLHLKDSTRDAFDQRRDAGERFADLEGPWDLVNRFRLDAGREWKRKKGVTLGVEGGLRYDLHANNRELSHPRLDFEASARPRKGGRTGVAFSFVPRHFTKNYEHPELVRDDYLRGRRMEYAVALSHERQFSKSIDWEGRLFFESRDFNALFDGRDRDFFGARLELRKEMRDRVRWSNAVQFGRANSPERPEEGVTVDRSFHSFRFETGLDYRAPAWKLKNSVEVRLRDYSTDNPLDFDRFDRRDTRWSFRSKWSRELGQQQELWLELRFVSNSSDRVDGVGDPDIVPYDNLQASLGLERKF